MEIKSELQSLISVLTLKEVNFSDWHNAMIECCGVEAIAAGKPADQAALRLSYLGRTFLYTRAVLMELNTIFKTTPKWGRIANSLITQDLLHHCGIFSDSLAAFLGSDYIVQEGVLAPSKPLLTVLRRCLIVWFGAFDLIQDCILAKEQWWDKGQSGRTTETYNEIIPRQFHEIRKGELITSIAMKVRRRKDHLEYLAEYVRMLMEMSKALDSHENRELSGLSYTTKQEILNEVLTEDYIRETVKLVKELHVSEVMGICKASNETSADVEAKLKDHLVYLSNSEELNLPWQEELTNRCSEEAESLSGLPSQVVVRLAYLDKVFLLSRTKLIKLNDCFKITPEGMPLKHQLLADELFLYTKTLSENLNSFLGSKYFTSNQMVQLSPELFDVLYGCLVQCLHIMDLIIESQFAYELWWKKDGAMVHEQSYITFATIREGKQSWTKPEKCEHYKKNLSFFSKYMAMLVDMSKSLDGHGAQPLSDLEEISKGNFVVVTKAENQIPNLVLKLQKLSLQ